MSLAERFCSSPDTKGSLVVPPPDNACILCFFLQDEFLDVIYWFRQIIAVVLGVIWGVLPLRGFLGIAG